MRRESGNSTQPADADSAVRALIAKAIKSSPMSRQQIAEAMSLRLGRRVTSFMLDDYTAQTKSAARFPLAWTAIFCEVVGDDSPQRAMLGPRLQRLLALAEAELAQAEEQRRIEALRAQLLSERK